MNKTAIVLGATGLTGGKLLTLLLEDSWFKKVKVFGRSSTKIAHPKLEEHLLHMFELHTVSELFTGDVVFCCIGTTKAKTPDKKTYKKIDYGIPVAAARLAKQNGIPSFQVISAMGASATSSTFYNKVKGEMERDVLAVGIKNTYIFQPSLIGGDRTEKRFAERMAQMAMSTFHFLIPNAYKMIAPGTIAKAMIYVAHHGYKTSKIENPKMKEIIS